MKQISDEFFVAVKDYSELVNGVLFTIENNAWAAICKIPISEETKTLLREQGFDVLKVRLQIP